MLSPDLEQLYELLTTLRQHDHIAGVVIEDDLGYRCSIERSFIVGIQTDDPGLVIRLVSGGDPRA